ncbi:microtubule-associated proteins 70-5 [Actinidia rufa]|uniref:Microtubule-associated proteins 70-5 n=1 Tax=Actinidia rufa TaxID=165716 RepID=A0A7J0FXA1_9ERIC|nr:microtubule-associated proteins 70-5 [Actinidia rufa]
MLGIDELGGEELSLAHPDPVVLELNRLQNLLKGPLSLSLKNNFKQEKDRELGGAQNEIKALKATEVLKDKAIEELTNEFNKLDGKLRFTENLLEQKVLDDTLSKFENCRILKSRKLTSERKEALAAQFSAEATLRRVHANQKEDDSVPIESVIAPLEADIKMYKNEIMALLEDKKALERLTKSKEVALLEAEKILRSALERALIVEELAVQLPMLSVTTNDRFLNCMRRREPWKESLARVKVSANRVATVVANEWKGENDKVMPVKQWLDERRLFQAEMQRLRDKLVVSERTANAEAQLKDKLKLRLKTLEEGFKTVSIFSTKPSAFCGSPKPEKSNYIFGFLSTNTGLKKRSTSQPRASTIRKISPLRLPNSENETSNAPGELKEVNSLKSKSGSGENLPRKSLWASRSKVVDSGEKENKEMNGNTIKTFDKLKDNETAIPGDIKTKSEGTEESQNKGGNSDDKVSGFLYDRLQKEVIALRRFCEVKDSNLHAKDEEIKVLVKKVDTLTKAIEVEAKKLKREAVTKEKESVSAKMDDIKKIRNTTPSKSGNRVMKAS